VNKKISNIVVLGANGQVGTEVCLYLKNFDGVDVTAVVRNEFSTAILSRLNIKCLFGELSGDKKIKNAIADADVVLDLAGYATGSVIEVNNFYSARLKYVVAGMKKDSNYVFASTMNALGFTDRSPKLKHHFLSSSIYCASKRYAEKLSIELGKKYNVNVFVFRFGQVHGVLQKCTAVLRKLINEGYSFTIPDTPSWTIFAYSIAEALVNVSNKLEKPGVYMLVSPHEWSWKELLNYIAQKDQLSVATNIAYIERRNYKHYLAVIKHTIFKFLSDRRDYGIDYLEPGTGRYFAFGCVVGIVLRRFNI